MLRLRHGFMGLTVFYGPLNNIRFKCQFSNERLSQPMFAFVFYFFSQTIKLKYIEQTSLFAKFPKKNFHRVN